MKTIVFAFSTAVLLYGLAGFIVFGDDIKRLLAFDSGCQHVIRPVGEKHFTHGSASR